MKLCYPRLDYPAKLSDPDANPIACTAIDGTVGVIPEFPSFLIMSLLVAMPLAVILPRMKHTQRNK